MSLGIVDLRADIPGIGRIDQPLKDFYKRDIEHMMHKGLWDLDSGIRKDFIRSLYDNEMNPFLGNFRL